jgi:hypothetical protein
LRASSNGQAFDDSANARRLAENSMVAAGMVISLGARTLGSEACGVK